MSQPDYENLAFEPDMTWEEFVKWLEENTKYTTVVQYCSKRQEAIVRVKERTIEIRQDCYMYLNGYTKFKSFKAIKRVITAIMESVVDN